MTQMFPKVWHFLYRKDTHKNRKTSSNVVTLCDVTSKSHDTIRYMIFTHAKEHLTQHTFLCCVLVVCVTPTKTNGKSICAQGYSWHKIIIHSLLGYHIAQLPLTTSSKSHLHNHIRQTWQNPVRCVLSNSKSTSQHCMVRDTVPYRMRCGVHRHAIVRRSCSLNTANIDRNNGNDGCGNVYVYQWKIESSLGAVRARHSCGMYSNYIQYN